MTIPSPASMERAVQVVASICDATGKTGWGGTRIKLVQQAVALALDAQIERDARIAEAHPSPVDPLTNSTIGEYIATAIRKQRHE